MTPLSELLDTYAEAVALYARHPTNDNRRAKRAARRLVDERIEELKTALAAAAGGA